MVRFIRSTCPFVHGWRGLARLGAAWRGLARLGAAWRGLARLGAAWRGLARLGAAWRGLARLGAAWRGLARLGQTVRHIVLGAGEFERVGAEELLARQHRLDLVGGPGGAAGLGEVGAIVGEYGVNPIGHSRDQVSKEVAGNAAGDLLRQLHEGELGCAVDRDQPVELALLGSDFREVDVEVADRVALELGASRLVAVGAGQAREAVALQAPVPR